MLTCVLPLSRLGLHPLAFWARAPCPRGENRRLFLPLCPNTPHLSSQLRCSFWFAALGGASRAEPSWGSLCLSCAHSFPLELMTDFVVVWGSASHARLTKSFPCSQLVGCLNQVWFPFHS